MAMTFNNSSVFNLTPISEREVRPELFDMLIPDEYIVMGFKTIRDQLVFTNKRIISIDVQGITGKRRSYTTMPYSKVQFFSITTPGFVEFVPDSELDITFADGTQAHFEIKGNANVGEIEKVLAGYVLQ